MYGTNDTRVSIMVPWGAGEEGIKNVTGEIELYSCFISKLGKDTWVNFLSIFSYFGSISLLKKYS